VGKTTLITLFAVALGVLVGWATAQPPPTATQVRIFTPFTTSGLSIGLAVTDRVRGSCFASSAADPARPDAWRCEAGNAIHDPCFANLDQTRLACAEDPTSANAVMLTLTKDLPADAAGREPNFKAAPWALELENGQTCTPLTGATAPIAGMRINYGCGDDAYIAGSVDRSRPLWRVFYQTPTRSLSLQQVAVTTAWY
jgi:hypothetical protein